MNRLKELRLKHNMSMADVARALNIPYTTYVNYDKGERELNSEMLIAVASLYKVSVDYLIGRCDTFDISNTNLIPLTESKQIPLLGEIACGDPILAEENIQEVLNIGMNINADFALTCKGDSMINARIFDGDTVFIRMQPEVENGEIAAVLIDNEATLKKVYLHNDRIVLSPCNPLYNDLIYIGENMANVRILGKAVACIYKFDN